MARKRARRADLLKEEGKLDNDLVGVRNNLKKVKEELAIARKAIEGVASARAEKSTQKVTLAASLERTFAASIETLRDKLRGRVEQLASEAFRKMTTQFVLFVHGGEIRREADLDAIKERVGAVYDLVEISETQTKIERSKL